MYNLLLIIARNLRLDKAKQDSIRLKAQWDEKINKDKIAL